MRGPGRPWRPRNSPSPCVVHDLPPYRFAARQRLHVAQDPQAMFGPRQRDIGAVGVGEEANLAGGVTPHGGEDDHVLLRALEPVHGPHLHRERPIVHRVHLLAKLLLDGRTWPL